MSTPVLQDFEQRGLIADVTTPAELGAHLADGPRTIYVGFDPTADSLHVGSLLPLLALRRIQQAGHRPIVLVGGGTGLIGDPSGKAGERALSPEETVAEAAARLKEQVRPFLDFDRGPHAAILVDNYEWLSRLELIPFLRDIGKHFGVGAMMARESVRARLGSGLSFTEFTYQALQAYDFLALYQRHGCTLQMGGSDQWGNITAGTELIHKMEGGTAFGLTLPLVAKADGTKFGKTETGTIWLDAKRTSPYAFYQYWLNTADADVYKFLNYFTFLSVQEITAIEAADKASGKKPEAQRILAEQVTELVHGKGSLEAAQRITASLFSGSLDALTESDLEQLAQDGMPGVQLEKSVTGLIDALVAAGLAKSKSEA